MSDSMPPQTETPSNLPRLAPPKRRRWGLWICGGLLAVLLLLVATVAITIWWMQRPIKPVVLSEKEKTVVEAKLQRMGAGRNGQPASPSSVASSPNVSPVPNRTYVPGGKELRLTERELNGLLNQNTELGNTVRLELDTDAINAYVAVPIPKDFPVGGGKMFRARSRFRMSLSSDQAPVAMLEDVTVFGLSLPKEWLGGVKGKNLLADAVGKPDGATWRGIKSLRVVPGAIVLEVGD